MNTTAAICFHSRADDSNNSIGDFVCGFVLKPSSHIGSAGESCWFNTRSPDRGKRLDCRVGIMTHVGLGGPLINRLPGHNLSLIAVSILSLHFFKAF
ncbi:unnamed protein product [Lactuca saligna]|uniref:Uncharacterized protein n=1 Tax=Lactuca saligna TaxID=75948 RepID=A0AA35V9H9_LACSI|nr:unnamed protein product [Lactuca saligna]